MATSIVGHGTRVFAERDGSVSIILPNQEYKGNGIEITYLCAIDVRIRVDEIVTAKIELLALDIPMKGGIKPIFMVQNKEVEKITYKDGSVFPAPIPKITMEESNKQAFEQAGISRIH